MKTFRKMQFLKAEILFLLVFFIDYIRSELDPNGENVCLTTENYSETVMVQVQKKKRVRKLCWRLLCSKTKLINTEEPRVFKRTRIVAKCCSGYREEIGRTDCVPECLKGCENGKCIAPNTCACDPGFHGLECDKECPEGRWGLNCVNKCACSDNGKCKKAKGCECKPGWIGDRCDLPCQEGYYGNFCEKKCNCDLACNHENGECITSTITPSPPAATKHVPLTSTNGYRTTESNETSTSEVTGRNQISVSESSGSSKAGNFTEVVDTIGSRSGDNAETEEDEVDCEMAAVKDMKLSHSVTPMKESTKNIREDAVTSDPIPRAITEPFPTDFTLKKSSEEITQKGKKIKFHLLNEDLETFMRNATIKETEAQEYANEVSRGDTLDEFLITNKNTFWTTFTSTKLPDKDETDDFISNEKGSAPKDYLNTKFHFFASLCILSGISLIIFAIAARWIIVSHRRKVQKVVLATKKEKMLHAEQGKAKTQKLSWVNSCAENPVYLTDVDINKAVPILQTFKPVN